MSAVTDERTLCSQVFLIKLVQNYAYLKKAQFSAFTFVSSALFEKKDKFLRILFLF